ncbi:hypothetical protein V6N11_017134 [Hibiscus sabdariffa]|uniref:Leucine-rich repeat-containing N-terminal plant-type domain-containing protein n=1 Tax=Hibiscus sabdariffa TaxID=183260 RepID=A0ABR2TXY0_9ROSI
MAPDVENAYSTYSELLAVVAIRVSFCDGNSNVLCIESEREALLKLKNDLIDPSNRLSSWVEAKDCCEWNGVVCHNSTGHVHQLHLAAPFSALNDYEPLSEREAYCQFIGLLESLTYLNLSQARFQGPIPENLVNLSNLQYLDLRGRGEYTRPWDFKAKSLQWISGLSSLQYLDLSYVDLGEASDWLQDADQKFYLSASLVLKGRDVEYSTTLSLVTSMDLSVNSLTGEIPKEVGILIGLRSLNISGNKLTGNIPDNIGNLELMESLDLSMNQLHGEIPSSLSNLSFLYHFNVYYNKLTGKIPTGTQLQSFENSSYIPNHLCGPPVSKNCSTNNGGSSGRKKLNGFYVSMGFWGVVAPLFFIRSWRHAYYQKLEHIGRKLYVFWATIGM